MESPPNPQPTVTEITQEYNIDGKVILTAKYTDHTHPQPNEDDNEANNETSPEQEEIKITTELNLSCSIQPLIFHWGIYPKANKTQWSNPYLNEQPSSLPENTKSFDKNALQSTIPVSLNFKYSDQKSGLNFVFYNPTTNKWYNNNSQNYSISFLPPNYRDKPIKINGMELPSFLSDVFEKESNYNCWSLMHRYNLIYDILTVHLSSHSTPNDWIIWILIYIRYSNINQLTWQRHYNTRPIFLSNSLNKLTLDFTTRYIASIQNETKYTSLLSSLTYTYRSILSFLGKGTGNGQQIRDEILQINHRHRMKQGGDRFYEEWHQKLHNNTTPDDIIICEAVIAFLQTGKIEDYRNTWLKGGITKTKLESYERKITLEPRFVRKEWISEFTNFWKILKSVHSNDDLEMMYESAKCYIDRKEVYEEIIRNKRNENTIQQIERLVTGRKALNSVITDTIKNKEISSIDISKIRDWVFWDIALENYLRQWIEQIIHWVFPVETYVHLISLILSNIGVSFTNYTEVQLCWHDWNTIAVSENKATWKVKAVINRISRVLANIVDYYNTEIGPRAIVFGKNTNINDPEYSSLFAEELIRGSIFFVLSMLIKKLDNIIRKEINFGDWNIISLGAERTQGVKGKLIIADRFSDIQYEKYQEKVIVLTRSVTGEEEIPLNCNGIIIYESDNYPDVWSHVAVRSRNSGVLFVVNFNPVWIEGVIKEMVNQYVNIQVNGTNVTFERVSDSISWNEDTWGDAGKEGKLRSDIRLSTNKCDGSVVDRVNAVLTIDVFNNDGIRGYLGAKSWNTATIYNKILNCPWLKYPESLALPNYLCDYFLSHVSNKGVFDALKENEMKWSATNTRLNKKEIQKILANCKRLVSDIKFVENEHSNLIVSTLERFGVGKDIIKTSAFAVIKQVWASKYNERVFLSLLKQQNISLSDIKMAVLIQKIIPADYAFVIHTKNPLNNKDDEIYAEVVNGLGEALVGAYEGQAFSFVYSKQRKDWEIKSYQNKSVKLKNSSFIFRSDSNIEDQEGFSGAGLFDSIPLNPDEKVEMVYDKDEWYCNEAYRNDIIDKIAKLGLNTESLFNGIPQDIEGVIKNGEVFIVQTRPQV